jgi:hypothetical protein
MQDLSTSKALFFTHEHQQFKVVVVKGGGGGEEIGPGSQ